MANKKMKERVEEYIALFNDLKNRVGDERTALGILQEVTKDIRMEQIREERNGNGHAHNGRNDANGNGDDAPATERQKSYLEKLGVEVPEKLTKKQASALIDEELEKESEKGSSHIRTAEVAAPWQAAW